MKRLVGLCVVCVAITTGAAAPQSQPRTVAAQTGEDFQVTHEIRLKSGSVLQGQLIETAPDAVVFRMRNIGVVRVARRDVVTLAPAGQLPPAPTSTPRPWPTPTPKPQARRGDDLETLVERTVPSPGIESRKIVLPPRREWPRIEFPDIPGAPAPLGVEVPAELNPILPPPPGAPGDLPPVPDETSFRPTPRPVLRTPDAAAIEPGEPERLVEPIETPAVAEPSPAASPVAPPAVAPPTEPPPATAEARAGEPVAPVVEAPAPGLRPDLPFDDEPIAAPAMSMTTKLTYAGGGAAVLGLIALLILRARARRGEADA
jgi:hypothetical protein